MSRKKIFKQSAESLASRTARAREVRDLYNKLRKKYRPDILDKFFRENYFIQPKTVEYMISKSDTLPVDIGTSSLIYKHAIQETFHL